MASVTNALSDVSYAVLAVPDALIHPLLHRLLNDWHAAAPSGALPGHGFIDPMRLNYLLGQLLVVEVHQAESDALRFHYRLIGTALVDRLQKDYTGHWMDEHEDSEIASAGTAACRLAVIARQPVRVTAVRRIDASPYPIEYLLLPLTDVGSRIDRLLIAQIYPTHAPHLPYRTGS